MATRLDKELFRELPREGRMLKLTPEGVYMREKRKRMWYGPVSWNKVFMDCVNIQVNERLDENRRD
jgi:hypothetical protein